MLITLNVKNFAIIDNIQIDFNEGLTVLTGETGAGKSLIIDAISLLFGERASNELIRYGEQKAIIEGIFSNYDNKIISYLNDYNIEYDENDYLIIKRELFQNGKSICKINNQTITLNQLKQFSSYIGDIHSQLDTFGLINPKNYLSFLKTEKIDNLLLNYQESLKDYEYNIKQLTKLENNIKDNLLKEDYLKYQLNELKKANLNPNEEEELQNELKILSNSEKMKSLILNIKDNLENNNLLNNLYDCINSLDKLSNYNQKFSELKVIMEESYYNLEDLASNKLLVSSSYDFDEQRYNEINERLAYYSELKRKYKMNTIDLINYYSKVENDLNSINNSDLLKEELTKKVKESYQKTLQLAKNLREERKKQANYIEQEIKNHLLELQLNNANFIIQFNDDNDNFNKEGIDSIDFLVSFNKGEPLKSLSKTASGGELSRFMLSLKTVLDDQLSMQTKIFDEIDSGVSGNIAYAIGKKLQQLSLKSQVICITHLPQVASLADNHFKISKIIENERTYTKIINLSLEERIKEIASMMSNNNITEASLKYAEELLNIQ